MKRKVVILSVLLAVSLSTVFYVTYKYIATVRLYSGLYENAIETVTQMDNANKQLEKQITLMEENINLLNEKLSAEGQAQSDAGTEGSEQG